MSIPLFFSIEIEGDFIDSFLYSGTLFLVHADSKITTHAWEALLNSSIVASWGSNVNQSAVNFIKDCRLPYIPTDTNKTISVENDKLIEYQRFSLQLSGWPTDINIYSNRLYIASEKGVDELDFNYESRTLKEESKFNIYSNYAYKISPNNGHRIAIAAGLNGVIAAHPRTHFIKPDEDLFSLIDIDAHDCEWVGENLTANSLSGAFLLTFHELPKHPDGDPDQDYWKTYNEVKKIPPASRKITSEVNGSCPYIWVAGSKIFELYETGDLVIEDEEEGSKNIRRNKLELPLNQSGGQSLGMRSNNRILSARTSQFGTVVEIEDSLYLATESGIELISHRPVSWRVFPRAKSYLNQLHIIENDSLIIRAYIPQSDSTIGNRFGITFDEVI
jgi:hypothetical protein